MTAPFRYQTDSSLKFIDVAILEFYDQARQVGVDVVARRILREYAVADKSIVPADLKRIAKRLPQVTNDPAYLREVCEEADSIPGQRAGRSSAWSDSARRMPTRDPASRRMSFRLSPYELALLEYLTLRFKLPSRQRTLEVIIRYFAVKDVALKESTFRAFAIKLMDQYPAADRGDNELQLDAFLRKKKAS